MTDDLLTAFRSDIPFPDDATARRIYFRAKAEPRRVVTRGRVALAVAVLAAAGTVVALGTTPGRRAGAPTVRSGPTGSTAPGGAGPTDGNNPPTVHFTASGNEYTSIDLTIRSSTPEAIGRVLVFRSDASDAHKADNAPDHVVFREQVSVTSVKPTAVDPTQSTWSGTLTPSEWAGGCQHALYRITFDFGYPPRNLDAGGWTGWFQCKGPEVDPANPFPAQGPTGQLGPTGH
jgi:hypothetical protein